MALKKTNSIEKLFVYLFTGAIDLACFVIAFIPGIDLLGWPLKMFGEVSLNIYFLIKGGFGGRRAGQKLAATVGNAVVAAVPALDDFIPSLTIQSVSMYWILDKEAAESAEEAAKKAAANENGRRQNLSRAA